MASTIWNLEDTRFPTHLSRSQHNFSDSLEMSCYADFKWGGAFCAIPCTAAVQYYST